MCLRGSFQELYLYRYDSEYEGYIRIDEYSWGDGCKISLKKDEIVFFGLYSEGGDGEEFVVKKIDTSKIDYTKLKNHKATFYDFYGTPEQPSDLVKFDDEEVEFDIAYDEYVEVERGDPEPVYEYTDGIPQNPGLYIIKVTGKNGYSGTKTDVIKISDEKDISKMIYEHYDIQTSKGYLGLIRGTDIFKIYGKKSDNWNNNVLFFA